MTKPKRKKRMLQWGIYVQNAGKILFPIFFHFFLFYLYILSVAFFFFSFFFFFFFFLVELLEIQMKLLLSEVVKFVEKKF